jgi:DNA-binding beta-propeller fold protein YncE
LALGTALSCNSSDSGGGLTPLGQLGGTIITTNQADATLSVVDPATGKLVGPLLIPVIEQHQMEMPHEISTDPKGQFFLVNLMEMPADEQSALAGQNQITMMNSTLPGYLLKFGRSDGAFLGKVQVDADPGDNAISPDGSVAYVSHFNQPEVFKAENAGSTDPRAMDSDLWAIDTATMTVITKIPICPLAHIMRISPDGLRLFVPCLNDEIAVIDIASPRAPSLVTRVSENPSGEVLPSSATHWPWALAVSPKDASGNYSVWISDWESPFDVRVLDGATLKFDKVLPTFWLPFLTTFSADGKKAYTAHQGPGGIAIFDVATRTQTDDIDLPEASCTNPHQILLSADESQAYVLCEGDHLSEGQFATLDLGTQSVVSSIPLGIYPVKMELLPK